MGNPHINVLIINPGSTSTKLEIWSDRSGTFKMFTEKKLQHTREELLPYKGKNVSAQIGFRKGIILQFLKEAKIEITSLDFIMGRGGLVPRKKFQSGVVEVNQKLAEDLEFHPSGNHPSNLGGILAKQLADASNSKKIKVAIMDPVVVDELEDIFRVTGIKEIEHKSIFHCLNQKAIAKKCASTLQKKYEDCRFIVAHLGGGISIGAHKKGKIVDVNNALEGVGPMSPERAGAVDIGELINLCFSGNYNQDQIKKMVVGEGGLFSHLGTSDCVEIEKRITQGDEKASLIYNAMIMQIAKSILSATVSFKGEKVDAIIITGGLAHSEMITEKIKEYVNHLAPIKIYAGELEGEALAQAAYHVLKGEEAMRSYI